MDPLDYAVADTEADTRQAARAHQAIGLAMLGHVVVFLHFLSITSLSRLYGISMSVEIHWVVYAACVVTECGLAVVALVQAVRSLRPKGTAADMAGLGVTMGLSLLFIATACGGMAFVGDVS